MITFIKKADPQPVTDEAQANRFEQIRKAAKEGHRKSDADGASRRARRTAEEDRLL